MHFQRKKDLNKTASFLRIAGLVNVGIMIMGLFYSFVVPAGAEDGEPECLELKNCTNPPRNYRPSGRELTTFDFDDETMNNYCGLVRVALDCLEMKQSTTTCTDIYLLKELQGYAKGERYRCSHEGRHALFNLKHSNSACVENLDVRQQLGQADDQCFQSYVTGLLQLFNFNGDDHTLRTEYNGLADTFFICARTARQICGPMYEQFMEPFMNLRYSYMYADV